MTRANWSTKRYFKPHEFLCSHCGIERMDEYFVSHLDDLRHTLGFPFFITSGYRCPDHPVEKAKVSPGAHTKGVASDIAVYGDHAVKLIGAAIAAGFRGFGIQQKGKGRFVHLDTFEGDIDQPRPSVWSY